MWNIGSTDASIHPSIQFLQTIYNPSVVHVAWWDALGCGVNAQVTTAAITQAHVSDGRAEATSADILSQTSRSLQPITRAAAWLLVLFKSNPCQTAVANGDSSSWERCHWHECKWKTENKCYSILNQKKTQNKTELQAAWTGTDQHTQHYVKMTDGRLI